MLFAVFKETMKAKRGQLNVQGPDKRKYNEDHHTFVLPMIAGNLLQQFYNIADTLIVGRFLGRDALAAVGSAYTLMTFLTSVLLGLSMGRGIIFHLPGKGM